MNLEITNEFYELRANSVKNRLYIKIIGFWQAPNVVPNYLSDIKEMTEHLRSGFSILADLREMRTCPASVVPIHEEGLQITKAAGVEYSAEVISDTIANMQMKKMYREHDVNDNKFGTIEEAEAFLDSQSRSR